MRNRTNIKKVLDHCINARNTLPEISGLGTNNYDELDEQIIMLSYCLEHGRVPYMGHFKEHLTNSGVLWVLELNTFYDCIIEEE